MKPRAALFYGAGPLFFWALGGRLTSWGMTRLRNSLVLLGVDAQCFNFNEVTEADQWLREGKGPILGYGYSLGNTSLTFLQTQRPFDLVFCIALSEFAGKNNQSINKSNTARACLARGPGRLSDAMVSGFDEVRVYTKPHLLMDLDQGVKDWALTEARAYL